MCESEGLEHKQRGVANLLSTKRPVCCIATIFCQFHIFISFYASYSNDPTFHINLNAKWQGVWSCGLCSGH